MNKKEFLDKYRNQLLIGIGVVFVIILSLIFFINKRTIENTWLSSSNYVFGIDVSNYQGRINWNKVKRSKHPIKFVFIRSTMGTDGIDSQFKRNWEHVNRHKYIRGAYHYYRPNEDATAQFNNFAKMVTLKKGDFPPILDIEQKGTLTKKQLRESVLKWLKLAEKKYGIKPVVYTGRKFYKDYLKGHIKGYPLWIASYSAKHKLQGINWSFHQFSEKVRVKGISHYIDGNDFNGNLERLKGMCIQ